MVLYIPRAGIQTMSGLAPASRISRHATLTGVWKPPMTAAPRSASAWARSEACTIKLPGQREPSRRSPAARLSSRVRSPRAVTVAGADFPGPCPGHAGTRVTSFAKLY